jgi:hypothetical protein
MATSLKVILAATAVAVLASPVMAQSLILRARDPIPEAAVTAGNNQVVESTKAQPSPAHAQAAVRSHSRKKTD